jgi:CheY-like chemotaxis protein
MLGLLKVSISKHATLETNLSRALPFVRGMAAQVQQIAMNLVTNASEAIGDRDGVIGVTTRLVTVDRAAAIWRGIAEGDYAALEVSDTGCGMSRETQARMFDPFFTTKSVGHGLGLAVVQGIVRKVAGAIHFTSEPGRGTTVQILLPCAEAAAESITEPTSATGELAPPVQRFTVLVVEDEDPLRRAVAKMLRKTGYEVLEEANGSAAIDLLHENGGNIDLILLDMTIPGRSSQEVIAEAAQARPDLKVVLTSAYSEETATATITAPLVRGFIRKPFQLRGLAQTLRDVLSS